MIEHSVKYVNIVYLQLQMQLTAFIVASILQTWHFKLPDQVTFEISEIMHQNPSNHISIFSLKNNLYLFCHLITT